MSKGTVNKVILVGRLGRDPEMRYTPNGTAVATFSLATNYRVKDQDGNFTDKTEWHNIVAFGQKADLAGEYLAKGKLVYIEGRIQTRVVEDQSGQKKYYTDIVCANLQMLGGKGEMEVKTVEEEASEDSGESPVTGAEKSEQETAPAAEEQEDDLPF
jgi:single-strand DNA-binding protein